MGMRALIQMMRGQHPIIEVETPNACTSRCCEEASDTSSSSLSESQQTFVQSEKVCGSGKSAVAPGPSGDHGGTQGTKS